MCDLNLSENWRKQNISEIKKELAKLIWNRIQEREQRTWWKKVKTSPKLRTYVTFKRELIREEYLKSADERGRRTLTRFRSGTNELRIETGRYEGGVQLAVVNRKCWFGCDTIEDEKHVIFECDLYKDLRKELKRTLKTEKLEERSLCSLLGGGTMEETEMIMTFLKRSLARRTRLLRLKG